MSEQNLIGPSFFRAIIRHRYAAMALLIVAIGALVTFVPHFVDNLGGATFAVTDSPSERTQKMLVSRFPELPTEQDIVVFHSDKLTVDNKDYRAFVDKAQQALTGKPFISSLLSPYDAGAAKQVSSDRKTAFMIVGLKGSDTELQKNSTKLSETLPDSRQIESYLTGYSPINADVIEQENKDIAMADAIGLPIAFLVLLIAFGSLIAAGLPLLVGVLGIVATFGILGIARQFMVFDVFVESAVTMIGLALGIDYCLLIVTRFREELAKKQPVYEAVMTTMKTAGGAVLFSGLTVLISLSGLLLVHSPLFKGIAVGTMITVASMLVLCLTLLPIILYILGERINKFRLFKKEPTAKSVNGFWMKWAYGIMRRPVIIGCSVIAVLLLIATPVLDLKLGLNLGADALHEQDSAKGLRLVKSEFSPGIISPIQIVVSRGSDSFTDKDLTTISTIEQWLMKDTRVDTVSSLPQSLKEAFGENSTTALAATSLYASAFDSQLNTRHGKNVTVMTVIPKTAVDDEKTTQLFKDITARLNTTDTNNLHIGYTGSNAQITDLNNEVQRAIPIVLAYVLGFSFILLAFHFRSLLLPLKAILMNLLALSATFGVVVVVFQYGLGEQLLNFTSPHYIQNYLPLLTFVILFGLSMDYEVFLLTRMKEEWNKTHNNTDAVAIGLEHTAKVITNAAAIMIVVFLSFLIAGILEIKQLGFALAAAVLIDATLIRLLLVPAAMRLMGKWNWWSPRWMRKR